MSIRAHIKSWVYCKCPGFSGTFPYFGTRVYFPKGSAIVRSTCLSGVFEVANVRLLQHFVRADTWLFDIGANIGLMAAPILATVPGARVASFEPSPTLIPYLSRTMVGCPHSARWALIPKAVGAAPGRVQFSLSAPENAAFDGVRSTNRVPTTHQVEVEMTTIDLEWEKLGNPVVSAIKCDVEGSELEALRGARKCLESQHAPVLLEWNSENQAAYGVAADALFDFAREIHYEVVSLPNFVGIATRRELLLQMTRTENFLLLPVENY